MTYFDYEELCRSVFKKIYCDMAPLHRVTGQDVVFMVYRLEKVGINSWTPVDMGRSKVNERDAWKQAWVATQQYLIDKMKE